MIRFGGSTRAYEVWSPPLGVALLQLVPVCVPGHVQELAMAGQGVAWAGPCLAMQSVAWILMALTDLFKMRVASFADIVCGCHAR